MTPADAAQARADEATETRIEMEAALLDVPATRRIPVDIFDHPVTALMAFRSVESLTEGGDLEFSRIFSAARRAQRMEARARSAALRAQLVEPVTTLAPVHTMTPSARHRALAEALVAMRQQAALEVAA